MEEYEDLENDASNTLNATDATTTAMTRYENKILYQSLDIVCQLEVNVA